MTCNVTTEGWNDAIIKVGYNATIKGECNVTIELGCKLIFLYQEASLDFELLTS